MTPAIFNWIINEQILSRARLQQTEEHTRKHSRTNAHSHNENSKVMHCGQHTASVHDSRTFQSTYHTCAAPYTPAVAPTISICTFKLLRVMSKGSLAMSFLVTFNNYCIFCCCMTLKSALIHPIMPQYATFLALTLTPTVTFLWFWNPNTNSCILATKELNPNLQEEQILELQASGRHRRNSEWMLMLLLDV